MKPFKNKYVVIYFLQGILEKDGETKRKEVKNCKPFLMIYTCVCIALI